VKIRYRNDDSLDSILERLRALQHTPYMSSKQKEIRRMLGKIIEDLEGGRDIDSLRKRATELDEAIHYDVFWD